MSDATKNVLIGLFVVAASAIVIFILLFLHPTVGDDAQNVRVRFAMVDKISVGTRVTYGGKPVGEVIEIHEVEDPKDARKPGKGGFVYLYELVLGIDSKVRIYNTDQIISRTSGLLGEKSVEISPQAAKPGEKVYLVGDQVLYADESGSVEETLKEFKQLSDKIEDTLDSLKFAIDELNRQKIWEKIGHTAQNLSDITTALNKPEIWSRMLETADQVAKKADGAMTSVQNVAATVERGEGTVGGLLMRDDAYLQALAVLSKGETVVDDINHYGLLYQNDKRWQRLRARRANLITRLSRPEEFRNYFNDELNEVTASLARVSMVLEETEGCDGYQSYMDDCEFRKVFAELLRRINRMEESLKLYNLQVTERDKYQFECEPECN